VLLPYFSAKLNLSCVEQRGAPKIPPSPSWQDIQTGLFRSKQSGLAFKPLLKSGTESRA